MDAVAEHERLLAQRLRNGLAEVPGLELLALWDGAGMDRVGVAAFNLDGYRHPLLAAILSAEHAIGVRHGCFCAHPLMARLLGIDRRRDRAPARRAARRPAPARCRARCVRASASARRPRTSTCCSTRSARSPVGPRERYEHVPELDEYRPRGYAAGARWSSSSRVTSSARSIAAM